MNDSPFWLWLLVTYLFAICWIGATVVAWKVTRGRSWLHRCLWCVAVFVFPITGFFVFAWRHRVVVLQRWKWVVAHVILIVLGTASYQITRHRVIVHVDVPQPGPDGDNWWLNKGRTIAPTLCVAMSGGGIRSAAFNIGVLRALHENGLLARTDVMSAVSGGSYALSWYLLQQYYAQQPGGAGLSSEATLDAMFDWKEAYQRHLALHARQFGATGAITYYISAAISGIFTLTSYNVLRLIQFGEDSSIRNDYRQSIKSTFHRARYSNSGETLKDAEQVDQRFDDVTFVDLATFAESHGLPFFVFVTTVQVDADDQPGAKATPPSRLWPSIFELNARGLGSDSYGYTGWKELGGSDVRGGFAQQRLKDVQLVNVAPAISGAALSPASGGLSVRERLLTSLGYLDLGYRVPRFKAGEVGSLYLSDGGHSENLGLYPLVRRNCRNIIVIDAEHEPEPRYQFEAYFKVRRVLENELKRTLSIAVIDNEKFNPATPVVVGTISAASATALKSDVVYVKLAKDGTRHYGEPIDDPALGRFFPQDPTSDQNFDKLRFEAYRELGYLVARESEALMKLAQQLRGG